MAVSDEWRWTDDQGVQRVVRADELRSALASSVLSPSTLVWREGMAGWVPAFTVPELGAADGAPGPIAEPSTDGPTATDVAPPPLVGRGRVEPPSLVQPSKVVMNAPEPGGTADTGRPTPTELLPDGATRATRGANGAAGKAADTTGAPFKIGAAPKTSAGARPAAGKLESASSASKVVVPKPTGAAWRKPEAGKRKSDDELTLVAEGGEPFKVKAPVESGSSTAATMPAPGKAQAKGEGRAGGAFGSRRPVTKTALLPNEPAKPATGRPPSIVPPAPVPLTARRSPSSVPAAPGRRPSSAPPPAGKPGAGDPKAGVRSTAILGTGASARPGGARPSSVSVPVAPRIPNLPKPVFNIVDNSSTDSTGVLPLSGKYAAEPATVQPQAERAPSPSFVEGAPAFAERTPSFPDVDRAQGAGEGRATLRSQPPPGEGRATLRSQPPAGPALAAALADAAAPYSAPPPPLALGAQPTVPLALGALPPAGEPEPGEIRATGALPLVNPKRSYPSTPPPAEPPDAAEAGSQAPPADPSVDLPATPASKVGAPVVVPMSSLLGTGGVLIAMAVMAFFVGRCSVAPGASAAPARASLAAVPVLARAGLPPVPKPCWMAKQPVRWAPSVLQSVPVDVAPTASGVVVAYARDVREPATVQVDFAAGTFEDKASEKRDDELVRVFAPREGAGLLATTKSDEGPLAPYVFAPGPAPFVVGLAGRGSQSPSVAVAEKPEGEPSTLWAVPPVEDDKGLEAARTFAIGPSTVALVFRRSGNILGGFIGEGRKAEGGLGVVAGSGGSVGKPALGTNGREVAVVFADKASADTPWEIRVGHAPLGQMPRETTVVPLPKGGPGGDAFAPDVAGMPDGRWVLVWTEGRTGGYAVRAQTFAVDWKPLGDPIAISPPAGNFGQAVVGVAGGYVTTMFLSRGTSGSYELWGAVLQCGS